jgi:hypothetical protein
MENCCVIGPVKSGTTLMISLMDSHPELSLFPLEVKFFTHWVERLSSRGCTYKDLNHFFLKQSKIRLMNAEKSQETDIMNSGRINFAGFDFPLFVRLMEEKSGIPANSESRGPELFRRYLNDLHKALNSTISEEKGGWIVSKEGNHGAKHITQITSLFPRTKFVVLCRDPRDIYSSFKAIARRKMEGVNSPSFKSIVSPCRYVHENKDKNISAYEDLFVEFGGDGDFLFVRYESLVNNVRKEMTRVADFLNIQFDEILTRPTNLGNTWGGNSSIMTGFQAVQSERIGKWETELTPPERRLFEYFFRRYLGQWGYAIKEEKTPKAKIVTAAVKTELEALLPFNVRVGSVRVIKNIVKSIRLLMLAVVYILVSPDRLGR